MNNAERIERMRARLTEALTPEALDIVDESHKHVGHAGARGGLGHFQVRIVATAFQGRSLLERHRLVYEALGDMMQTDIHALGVRAYAPSEPGA